MCGARIISAAALALGIASVSQASFFETVTHTRTVPLASTNWEDKFDIPQFDDSLGELVNVMFSLKGTVIGSAQYESLDAAAAMITLNLQAEVTLFRPDLSVLVVALPAVNIMENAAKHDGMIDFDGPSGSTFADQMAMMTEMATTMDPADLALFTGLGTVSLPVTAEGTSFGSGAGNLIVQFATDAAAELTVKYTYKVPGPAIVTLLAPVGVMSLRRRRA